MQYILVALLLAVGVSAQDVDTIIDVARRNGGKANMVLSVESPVRTFDQLALESALAVLGRVRSVSTTLSHDKTNVVTEFEIAPERIYKGSLQFSNRPGDVKRILVQRLGGTLLLDGMELRTAINEFPEAESTVHVGDQLIVFLNQHREEPGKFRLTGSAFGIFRVIGSDVKSLTTEVALRRRDQATTIDAFERRVSALVRR